MITKWRGEVSCSGRADTRELLSEVGKIDRIWCFRLCSSSSGDGSWFRRPPEPRANQTTVVLIGLEKCLNCVVEWVIRRKVWAIERYDGSGMTKERCLIASDANQKQCAAKSKKAVRVSKCVADFDLFGCLFAPSYATKIAGISNTPFSPSVLILLYAKLCHTTTTVALRRSSSPMPTPTILLCVNTVNRGPKTLVVITMLHHINQRFLLSLSLSFNHARLVNGVATESVEFLESVQTKIHLTINLHLGISSVSRHFH
ncbi:hypothetical protein LXL04_016404 [Taraxacum kok-saghyz]